MSKELITKFYTAFSELDSVTMVSCYHDDIEFTDPGFGNLKGERAKAMWRMLCKNAQDFKIEFSKVDATENSGSAHWDASYTFRKTGRPVLNKIDAQFEFKNGKIIKHVDSFNLHNWARQAIGFQGLLLGGTSFFKKKLHQQTNGLLDKFMDSKPS